MKIKLKDLITYLDSADLSGLDVKKDLIKVCAYANITLQDIHQRLVINQEELHIPMQLGITEYCIDDYFEDE